MFCFDNNIAHIVEHVSVKHVGKVCGTSDNILQKKIDITLFCKLKIANNWRIKKASPFSQALKYNFVYFVGSYMNYLFYILVNE